MATDFGQSSSFADFLQEDEEIEEQEKMLHEEEQHKQKEIKRLREFNQGAAQYFGGGPGDDRPGGFGHRCR